MFSLFNVFVRSGKSQVMGEIKIALKKEMKTEGEHLVLEILQCRNITYKFKSPDHLPGKGNKNQHARTHILVCTKIWVIHGSNLYALQILLGSWQLGGPDKHLFAKDWHLTCYIIINITRFSTCTNHRCHDGVRSHNFSQESSLPCVDAAVKKNIYRWADGQYLPYLVQNTRLNMHFHFKTNHL